MFHIRLARSEDVREMARLLVQLFRLEPDFPIHVEAHQRGLSLLLKQPLARIWVAEADGVSGALLGMITVQPHISTGFGCLDGIVEDFVVDESWRGRGIGGRLFETMLAGARELGYTRLRLLADRENQKALDFYEKRGWIKGQMQALFFHF